MRKQEMLRRALFLLRQTGLLGVGILIAAAVAVTLWGGKGVLPSWNTLFAAVGAAPEPETVPCEAAVHFIDVGQGDSVLIECGGEYALIDCGTALCEPVLIGYLRAQGVERLRLLVMTHPHADHIGSMAAVLETFPVETLLLPDFSRASQYPDSYRLEQVLTAAENAADLTVAQAAAGDTYPLGEGTLTVLSTGLKSAESYNDISVCLRFSAGDFAFVTTGDAGSVLERALVDAKKPLRAQLLKAGHHGSSGSNSPAFLGAVGPQVVVVSCGEGNDYGHPHAEALENFAAVKAEVYRTDRMGTVVARWKDGALTVATERTEGAG